MLRLFRDQRGVSAVEFALIAPIMIMLYVGLAQLTLGMMAERRSSHAASSIGDLVAQQQASIKTADISQVLNLGTATVQPFPTTNLSMRVSSVVANPAGTAQVTWSQVQGGGLPKLAQNSTPAGFPANLLAAGESVIQSDVRYDYDLPIGAGLLNLLHLHIPTTMHFSETFYLRPRRAAAIACSDCPP
ncbi:TadE/TadG family type IV pilus assembly protein [Phenylobacterium sp.]|jgi:Flp pilus assembly protein TadG|uniref:TadE/TadG family type IV pilus assembly protein n=1 Tax=Phenylobacterium sp. TaxID=1871053 RepID=UPI002F425BC2